MNIHETSLPEAVLALQKEKRKQTLIGGICEILVEGVRKQGGRTASLELKGAELQVQLAPFVEAGEGRTLTQRETYPTKLAPKRAFWDGHTLIVEDSLSPAIFAFHPSEETVRELISEL